MIYLTKIMRKLGIDYGDARLGFALSDPMGIIASPLEVYQRRGEENDFKYIAELIKAKEVDTAVIGLPVNMDGSSGDRAQKSKDFGDKLKAKCGVKVEYIDERLTTVSAERYLIEGNVRREKRKEVIDKIAAQIILQSYLDRKR